MFPLLPPPTFLFPPSPISVPLNLSTSVSTSNQIRRVIASGNIPAGTCSDEFSFDNFLNSSSSGDSETVIEIYKSHDGKLKSKTYNGLEWILNISLSKDCHSYNVKLQESGNENKMILQVVKAIEENEEVALWFSDQLLAIMEVPFLTPSNIRGEKLYVCHICGRRFEVPNPLKIHLALDCERLNESHLWMRLKQAFKETFKTEKFSRTSSDTSETSPQLHRFHNIPKKISNNIDDTKNISNSSSPITGNLPQTIDKLSAFKPYSDRSTIFNGLRSSLVSHVPLNYILLSDPISHNFPINDIQSIPNRSIQYSQEGALELETLVSNLGKSKQGHLCIYCGKVYSRKYGLKIHIRTHTGYKPLKCKFCLRPFGDPSNLNKHVRLHAEGTTPYKCELCGKILVRRRDLDRHLKSRHSRGPHSFQGICTPSATMISNSSHQ